MNIPPTLTEHDAAAIITRAGYRAHPKLIWYPLVGVSFRITRTRGAARRLDGQTIYTLVDPATGVAVTCDPWTAPHCLAVESHVDIARRVAATTLMKHTRLAANFHLELGTYAPEILKPNYYAETSTLKILVDGLNGEMVVEAKPTGGQR